MISKLDLQRFSTSELAMGGVALAIVALVTLIDLRATQPRDPLSGQTQQSRDPLSGQPQSVSQSRDPLSSQPQSATQPRDPLSTQPQSTLQPRDQLPGPQSPLDQSSLEASASIDPPPSELSEPGGTFRQSPPQPEESIDPPSTNSRNVAQLPRQTTETADPTEPELNPQNPSNAIWVQARLADLGYFTGSRSGVWGPVSRNALRDFKSMNGLQEDDRWDRETEQRLSSKQAVPALKTFIGGWAEEIDQCRSGAPLVISSRAAKAVGGQCDFRSIKREGTTARWHVQAVCTDGGRSWNANVSLKLNSPQLIWSSERGTATYVRCAKPSPGEGESKPLIDSLGDWWQGVRKTVFVHE